MKSRAFRLTLATLLLVAFAASAHAAFFTVTLKNGTTFDIRYTPVKADWDPTYTMFLTDQGNWIAVQNDEIADVLSHAEENDYGYQLDTTTLFLGWSPNDLVEDGEDGEVTTKYEVGADVDTGANYSMDQFLGPVAGSTTDSLGGIGYGTNPGGDDN